MNRFEFVNKQESPVILNSLSTFLNTETKKKNTVEVFRFGVIWKFYQLEGKHIFGQ